MFYLAIETSCDDTSIALLYNSLTKEGDVLTRINQTQILGQVVSSQIKLHRQYGGVVPEIGARLHTNAIHYLLEDVLIQSTAALKLNLEITNISHINLQSISKPQDLLQFIDTISVTTEPGLPSALRVGLELAKSLQFFTKIKYNKSLKIKKVNHLRGHIASSLFISARHTPVPQAEAQ